MRECLPWVAQRPKACRCASSSVHGSVTSQHTGVRSTDTCGQQAHPQHSVAHSMWARMHCVACKAAATLFRKFQTLCCITQTRPPPPTTPPNKMAVACFQHRSSYKAADQHTYLLKTCAGLLTHHTHSHTTAETSSPPHQMTCAWHSQVCHTGHIVVPVQYNALNSTVPG
jgi:hypothetical protein